MARIWELVDVCGRNVSWVSHLCDIDDFISAPPKTRRFSQRPMYRFWRRRNGRNQPVRYCYTVRRNVAGYFVGWVETISKDDVITRRLWCWRRKKSAVMELAKQRYERDTDALRLLRSTR